MQKFWNFIRNDAGERILRLEGPIDEDSFWGDEVTPKAFRDELEDEEGDVTVWICSPGGNVFAAAEIYTMLCEHKGKITVKIDSIAASAASVVAMAGDRVLMSPVAMLMVHDPMTIAMGNAADMEKAIETLNEVKESIINAYQTKSGLSRKKISQLMSDETWMNARKAVEMGFADEILYTDRDEPEPEEEQEEPGEEKEDAKEGVKDWKPYSTRIMGQTILNRLGCAAKDTARADADDGEPADKETDVEPEEAGVTMEAETGEVPAGDVPDPEASDKAEKKPASEEQTKKEAGEETEGESEEETGEESGDGDEEESGEEPDEPGGEPGDPKKPAKDEQPGQPMIGMDGRTEDGSMPYDLLMKQLEFLK